MTVEQPALPRYSQTKPSDDHTYAQVKEITGIEDKQLINEAINACRNKDGKYEVAQVVNILINDEWPKSKESSNKKMAVIKDFSDNIDAQASPGPNGPKQPASANKNSKGVIDLTNVSDTNESEDIQKAIAASLQETSGTFVQETGTVGILGGQVSREEQDISRVLEQSLIENKAGTKRKRGDIWFVDPLNPHERKRNENWPIGLKNVGNTCWFSAVIQSLFFLKRFRHLVLTYQPKDVSQGNTEEKRNQRFMQELRSLFALMIGSRRKYVDPSKAVDILKEAFSSSVVTNQGVNDSQQDVSEFQHKLLEWLEDAFKVSTKTESDLAASVPPSSKSANNPMIDLFYGQYRADGINEGKGFNKEENFGQFPLQVNGFRDIHESLEAATAHREIETVSSEATQKSGQELWFTRLPPVLTFELSRFNFNQQLGRPEKIHNKIEFPQIIYMDRYMDCNRTETRKRREKAKKLKEELVNLQSRLDKFVNYGSGGKRFPLQDVLHLALEFAKSCPDPPRRQANVSQDVEMECLSPNNSMVVDSPVKSPATTSTTETVTSPMQSQPVDSKPIFTASSPAQSIPDVTMSPAPNIPTATTGTPPDVAMDTISMAASSMSPASGSSHDAAPHPRHVSDSELLVLQDCLHRWRTEVENDVRELQENITSLECSINQMYSDDSMTKHAYNLHAVLVHEGQAASGHYWAYIYDPVREQWLKFNDISVTEASWDELEKECVGGYHNASAYCLMYIDNTRIAVNTGLVKTEPDNAEAYCEMDTLPSDLREVVIADNKLFSEEIEKWDRDQARKAAGGGGDSTEVSLADSKSALPFPALSTVSTQTTQTNRAQPSTMAAIHARVATMDTQAALKKALDASSSGEKEAEATQVLQMVLEAEYERLFAIVSNMNSYLPLRDPRLQHIVTYLLYCQCPKEFCLFILIEQVAEPHPFEQDKQQRILAVRTTASQLLSKHFKQDSSEKGEKLEKDHKLWHERYDKYRHATALYIHGVSLYLEEKHFDALSFLIHSHLMSVDLRCHNKHAGLPDSHDSVFFLRQTLLHINDTITQKFEDYTEVGELLSSMNRLVLPCLTTLVQTGQTEDLAAVEEIREKWCAFLGQDIGATKVELLQDFLSKLFEPPPDLRIPRMPLLSADKLQNLAKQFQTVMERSQEYGYLERMEKVS